MALAFLGYGLNVEDSSTVILAGTLSVVIIITCTINYWHERQTSNVLASIKGMLPSHCTVVRDGSESSIVAETLVLGDVVHLKLGNRIPADIRLIHSSDLKIEMSSLTGESDAIECTPDKRSDMVTEARNVVFNSSLVMNGEGRGVVIRTGDASYIGAIAGLAGSTGQTKSSMEREVEHVALYITVFAVTCAIVLFIIALARGYGFTYASEYDDPDRGVELYLPCLSLILPARALRFPASTKRTSYLFPPLPLPLSLPLSLPVSRVRLRASAGGERARGPPHHRGVSAGPHSAAHGGAPHPH